MTCTDDDISHIRKQAALKIDHTAEVTWWYGYSADPYDDYPNLPEEYRCVGRLYFARAPGDETWVSFYDLPQEVRNVLYAKAPSIVEFWADVFSNA